MKNIHLLPTNQPSRLWIWMDELRLGNLTHQSKLLNISNQNLYITNNEKFVRDEYITDGIEVIKATPKLVNAQGLVNRRNWKKIILTTDFRLAPDVQSIDDEFLEWFVQNPTCEEVEIGRTNQLIDNYADKGGYRWEVKYHIYIPKEEPKIEFVNNTLFSNPISFELDMEDFEEPKQERLEDIQLEKVLGSRMCQYTVIENKLAILYKNQEQILKAIKLLSNQNEETPKDLMIKWREETSKNKNILEVAANKDELNHIEWIYRRMVNIHNENENYDYMVKFKNIIEKLNKL